MDDQNVDDTQEAPAEGNDGTETPNEEEAAALTALQSFRDGLAELFNEMAEILTRQRSVVNQMGSMAAHLPVEWDDEVLPPIQEMTGLNSSCLETRYRFTKFMRSSEIALTKVEAIMRENGGEIGGPGVGVVGSMAETRDGPFAGDAPATAPSASFGEDDDPHVKMAELDKVIDEGGTEAVANMGEDPEEAVIGFVNGLDGGDNVDIGDEPVEESTKDGE